MEDTTSSAVDNATGIILGAKLTVSEHQILKLYISQAASPELAAKHILRVAEDAGGTPIETVLRRLKEDWRALINKCM
jgi:ribulose kinase